MSDVGDQQRWQVFDVGDSSDQAMGTNIRKIKIKKFTNDRELPR